MMDVVDLVDVVGAVDAVDVVGVVSVVGVGVVGAVDVVSVSVGVGVGVGGGWWSAGVGRSVVVVAVYARWVHWSFADRPHGQLSNHSSAPPPHHHPLLLLALHAQPHHFRLTFLLDFPLRYPISTFLFDFPFRLSFPTVLLRIFSESLHFRDSSGTDVTSATIEKLKQTCPEVSCCTTFSFLFAVAFVANTTRRKHYL